MNTLHQIASECPLCGSQNTVRFAGDYHDALRQPGGTERVFGAKFDDYCRWLTSHVALGRSLDIGCATGLLVKKLADQGFEAEGYEANPRSADWGSKHYGVPIHTGIFDPSTAPPASYDLITMCDVLEHTSHPLRYLSSLRPLLRPRGHVMVAFPDVWSLTSRYYRARRMFESAGFDVIAFRRRRDFGSAWK